MIEFGSTSREENYTSPLNNAPTFERFGEDFEEEIQFEEEDPTLRDPQEIELEREVMEDEENDSDYN